MPGAWATEERAPIFDLVLPAFQRLPYPNKQLVWVAGADTEALSQRARGVANARVVREVTPIEKLMVASDVVITKANRGTNIDLNALGIPSVSLSFGLNPIDEMIIPRLRSNVALNARSLDAATVAEVIESVIADQNEAPVRPSREYRLPEGPSVAAACAELLAGAV